MRRCFVVPRFTLVERESSTSSTASATTAHPKRAASFELAVLHDELRSVVRRRFTLEESWLTTDRTARKRWRRLGPGQRRQDTVDAIADEDDVSRAREKMSLNRPCHPPAWMERSRRTKAVGFLLLRLSVDIISGPAVNSPPIGHKNLKSVKCLYTRIRRFIGKCVLAAQFSPYLVECPSNRVVFRILEISTTGGFGQML